jgi:hypothetical protein
MSRDLTASRSFAATSAVVTASFGVPLFLDPQRWSTWFGWRCERTELSDYFGRCLGAVALGVAAGGAAAVRNPAKHRSHFVLLEVGCWLLAAAHVRGALERRQPAIETAEIAGWAAFALAARKCAPPK